MLGKMPWPTASFFLSGQRRQEFGLETFLIKAGLITTSVSELFQKFKLTCYMYASIPSLSAQFAALTVTLVQGSHIPCGKIVCKHSGPVVSIAALNT